MRRCVYPRRGRGLTEGVTACAVGAVAHLRSAYRWCQPMPHAPSAVASCGWGYAYGDVLRRWGKPMDGGRCGCAIRWVMAGKWRTSGTQRLVSRRIPARYAALCVPGYGRVPSLCDERVQTEGWGFYNRSSAVDVRALVSRGRQANPVLTYETALRRFFRLWRCIAPLGHPRVTFIQPLFGGRCEWIGVTG